MNNIVTKAKPTIFRISKKVMLIFQIPLSVANLLFNLANITLIIGTGIVLISTILVIWTGTVKERYADDRISQNELETARANEEAAKARLELAKIDPNNLPIVKLSVHVSLSIRGVIRTDSDPPINIGDLVLLRLGNSKQALKRKWGMEAWLTITSIGFSGAKRENVLLDLNFNGIGMPEMPVFNKDGFTAHDLDAISILLTPASIPRDIVAGGAQFRINTLPPIEFTIPPQQIFNVPITSVNFNGEFKPLENDESK